MKTLLAAALVSSACAQDGTSLMQGMARRVDGNLGVDGDSKGHDTAKLMETATNMLKNGAGVTPDVEQFINDIISEINTNVLGEITESHHSDQNAINQAVAEMERVRSVCDADLASLANQRVEYETASNAHKECRHTESHKCGESRTCEVQLEIDWRQVKTQEARLREIHSEIHSEWCVDPLTPPHGVWDCREPTDSWEDCWEWTDVLAMEGPETSQTARHYPLTDYSVAVGDFRVFSVAKFGEYIEQKPHVEEAWRVYNLKIVECAGLETELATKNAQCDSDQDEIATEACTLGDAARTSRRLFGREWDDAIQLYDETAGSCTNAGGESCDIHATDAAGTAADPTCSCTGVRQKEFDRKREWETLKIVTCLLNTVYTHVQRAIESGEPCPTSESHPDQTQQEITHCHVVEIGLTANLTIDYCGDDLPLECPDPCVIPSPPESVCSAEYIYETQGYFGASLQGTFQPNQAVHLTLSEAGWGACAAPKVCEPCMGHAADLPVADFIAPSAPCLQHELHLAHGESDRDTFRCLGSWCLPMAGRCNGFDNCGDGSDEVGCDTAWQGHAFLQKHEVCRLGANVVPGTADDVQFFCNDGSCTAVEGRCNGVYNCDDRSDEALCPTDVEGVTLEPTSGHTATLETLTAGVQVFHDRGYTFKSLGSFSGMKFVKISNEDKNTPHSHVQLKLRIPQPLTVYVVTTQGQTLPWLNQQGWTEVHALSGVEYSGPRMTPDKDWHQSNNLYLAGQSIAYGEDLIDIEQEHYGPGHVWEKTFPAGVVSMPGNGGGQGYDWTSGIEGGHGSYLTLLAHPSHPPTPDAPLSLRNGNLEEGMTTTNYEYTNDIAGWTGSGGIVACLSGNAPWGGVVSEGSYYVALQGQGAAIEQSVVGHRPGQQYTLRVKAAQRQNSPGGTNAVLKITANGVELLNELITSATFVERVVTYTATSSSVVIRLVNVVGSGDQTVFVDDIRIEMV